MTGAFPVSKQGLSAALDFVAARGRDCGLDDSVTQRASVVLDELVSNLLRHDATLGPEDRFQLELQAEGASLRLVLTDPGGAFDPTVFAHTERPAIGGHGVDLIRGMSREFTHVRDGTENRTVVVIDPR